MFEPEGTLIRVLILAIAAAFLILGLFDLVRGHHWFAAFRLSAGTAIILVHLIGVRVRRNRQQDAPGVYR